MSFYANSAATALKEINAKGRIVTLRATGASAYDPATDNYAASVIDTDVKALIRDYTQKEIDGSIIIAGDKAVMLAASSLSDAPQINDIIIDDTKQYRVVFVNEVKPGDTALLYKLQVRK